MDKLNEWIGRDPAMDRSLERIARCLLDLDEGDGAIGEGLRNLKRAARGLFNATVSRTTSIPGSPDDVEEEVRRLIMACREAEADYRRSGEAPDLARIHRALQWVIEAHSRAVRAEQLALVPEHFRD